MLVFLLRLFSTLYFLVDILVLANLVNIDSYFLDEIGVAWDYLVVIYLGYLDAYFATFPLFYWVANL